VGGGGGGGVIVRGGGGGFWSGGGGKLGGQYKKGVPIKWGLGGKKGSKGRGRGDGGFCEATTS